MKDRVAVKIIEEVILPSCLDRIWLLCGRVRIANKGCGEKLQNWTIGTRGALSM